MGHPPQPATVGLASGFRRRPALTQIRIGSCSARAQDLLRGCTKGSLSSPLSPSGARVDVRSTSATVFIGHWPGAQSPAPGRGLLGNSFAALKKKATRSCQNLFRRWVLLVGNGGCHRSHRIRSVCLRSHRTATTWRSDVALNSRALSRRYCRWGSGGDASSCAVARFWRWGPGVGPWAKASPALVASRSAARASSAGEGRYSG